MIEQPIQGVLQKLLDPRTIKGPDIKDLEILATQRPGYLAFREVKMTVRPFLFITLSWNEEWAYSLLEGTEKAPKAGLISYQKTSRHQSY